MPRLPRVVLPDFAHHITQRGVRRGDIFFDDGDRALYLRHMKEQTEKFGVSVLCYCLMTNHVHLLAVPASETALANAIGEAHRRYTWQINRRLGATGYLFQGRFASCPLDESHLGAAARYVLLNPVRAGLLARAVDYDWSSAAFHAGETATDLLVKANDLMGLLPDSLNWRQLMEGGENTERQDSLRQTTRTGRPWGDANFPAHAELISGRPLQKKKPGPKSKICN